MTICSTGGGVPSARIAPGEEGKPAGASTFPRRSIARWFWGFAGEFFPAAPLASA